MKSTFITDNHHAELTRIASEQTKSKGKFVSLQDVLHEAIQFWLPENDRISDDDNG